MVTVKVDFTEEERAVLQGAKLTNHIVLEREPRIDINDRSVDPDIWHLRVRHLMDPKPDEYPLATVQQAKAYEEELMEALRDVKAAIEENSDTEVENKSYEL